MDSSTAERIDTERLRRQHPIAEVVERYGVELRRSGAALIGRCPFHADAGRPNLVVYPRSARFVCFRCQVRGDAIAFVQQIEQLGFRDAAQRLDASAVSPVPRMVRRRGPYRHGSRIQGDDEVRALAAAVELYANRLFGEQHALDYLAERGFERAVLVRQRVGFAVGDELVPYLAWRDDLPRYLGLPGPKPLLGWHQASRDRRGVCLVEGPLDLLTLQQWGVPGLALCGTGFSSVTMQLLGRWERLYAVLDADPAGHEATSQLLAALGSRLIPVALPPSIKDPAELAPVRDGSTLFRAAIRQAVASHSPMGGRRA